MNSDSIMTDFEAAMRNALRELLPHTHIRGCWFHYCRKASTLKDLLKSVNRNKQMGDLFRKFFYLPLLPADEIVNAFSELKTEVENLKHDMFTEYTNYLNKQWILKVFA